MESVYTKGLAILEPPAVLVREATDSTCRMRTLRDLSLINDTIDPLVTASVAVRLMKDRGRRIVGVVADGRFVGLLTLESALAGAPDVPVREIVTPHAYLVDDQTPIRVAAKEMAERGVDYAPVTRSGRYVGVLTALSLLEELGRSWDPMTGLSWSDRLRDWGIKALEAGREVTLLFADLDDFGAYNKRHGHIVGDRVIKALARKIQDELDPHHDVLVRYGGDEFVLGSTRARAEIESLRDRLTGAELAVEGVGEPVRFSLGVSGGKRTRERERVHFASTIDNLINLASQDCMAQKPSRGVAEPDPPVGLVTAPSVQDVCVDQSGSDPTTVTIAVAGRLTTGVALRTGQSALESVVQATADAIERAVPDVTVEPEDTLVFRDSGGQTGVMVQGWWTRQGETPLRLRAQAPVDGDVYRAASEAFLSAFVQCRESDGPERPVG